jgi:xanthine dehydrogenase small subunit
MQTAISFILDDKIVVLDFNSGSQLTQTTTVLNYLRSLPNHKGVKEGCAEGDCGACTVVIGELSANNKIHYRSVDSCLIFLPMLHGKQLITVENLQNKNGQLHTVQSTMVEAGGSQCGFCTPGIVMSMFSLYKNYHMPTREQIDDAITGNLCRCTGYKPIVEAAAQACVHHGTDHFTDDEPAIVELLKSIPHESINIKTKEQEYFRPNNLKEALSLKNKYPDAIIISGSTDVALRVTKGHEVLPQLIDLSGVNELQSIEETADTLTLGAGVILNDVHQAVKKNFQALHDILSVFGSQQIRNVATLGGNLGTASPISDTLPVLMAYNANIILQSIKAKREITLDDFILGYRKTARKPDELITAVRLPKTQNGAIVKSYKISKRKDLDISTVSAGFRLELNNNNRVTKVILSYGGMADCIKRSSTAEQFLIGKQWNREIVEEAMSLISYDFAPISDARGSAEFRTIAAKNILLKFWTETYNGKM